MADRKQVANGQSARDALQSAGEEGGRTLESLIARIAHQITDLDHRHLASLKQVHNRLETIGCKAEGLREQGVDDQALDRISREMHDLSSRVTNSASDAGSLADADLDPWQPAVARALAESLSHDHQEDGGDHEADPSTEVGPTAEARAPRRHQHAIAPPPASSRPEADWSRAWLDDRFGNLSASIEKSLSGLRTDKSFDALFAHLDSIEAKLEKVLTEPVGAPSANALAEVERHIGALANDLTKLEGRMARIDSIEQRLAGIAAQVSEERLAMIAERATARREVQISQAQMAQITQNVAKAAAERLLAERPAAPQVDPVAPLQALLEDYLGDRRRADSAASDTLDGIQQSILRLIDKVDGPATGNKPEPKTTNARAGMAAPDTAVAAPARPYNGDASVPHRPAASREPVTSEGPSRQARLPAKDDGRAPRSPASAGQGQPSGLPKTQRAVVDSAEQTRRSELLAARDQLAAAARRAAELAASRKTEEAPLSIVPDPEIDRHEGQAGKERREDNGPSKLVVASIAALSIAIGGMLYAGRTAPPDTMLLADVPKPQSTTRDIGRLPGSEAARSQNGAADPARVAGWRSEETATPTPARQETLMPLPGMTLDNRTNRSEPYQPSHARGQQTASLSPTQQGAQASSSRGPAAGANASQGSLEMPGASVGPLSLRMAAAKGDPSAEFEVAARYAEGKGIEQSFEQAFHWYQRSANRGFAPSQYRLGTLYERGTGIPKDLAHARKWYQRAADNGNIKAMHNLAVLSAGREQGSPDYPAAAQWFMAAGERGLPDSQFNLAILYESGLGVPRDNAAAYKWFALAAKGGDVEAGRRRDRIGRQLDAATRRRMDNAVKLWSAKPADRLANDAFAAGQLWKSRGASLQ